MSLMHRKPAAIRHQWDWWIERRTVSDRTDL